MTKRIVYPGLVGVGIAVFWRPHSPGSAPARLRTVRIAIDADDIGGVVTSANGPEAGVWVIAETTDLPHQAAKIVVTDDRGPLPACLTCRRRTTRCGCAAMASSIREGADSAPGKLLNLTAVVAPSASRSGPVLSGRSTGMPCSRCLRRASSPAPVSNGNGISRERQSQAEWVSRLKTRRLRQACHQLGNKATRELSPKLGTFKSSVDAWEHRVQVGQAGPNMVNQMQQHGPAGADAVGRLTDRVKGGEADLRPARPQGLERNVVLTQWDYGDAKKYYARRQRDRQAESDSVNANGPIYIDPRSAPTTSTVRRSREDTPPMPVRCRFATRRSSSVHSEVWCSPRRTGATSRSGRGRRRPHSSMMDAQGRVWTASRIREDNNPDLVQGWVEPPVGEAVSDHEERPAAHDVRSEDQAVDDDRHLLPARTTWSSTTRTCCGSPTEGATGDGDVIGWVDTKMYSGDRG